MLLTTLFNNMDNNEENASNLFDELALVNPFTNAKENIEYIHANKAKYESTSQNSETLNSVASCSKSMAENAIRSIEETDRQYVEKLQLELNHETNPLSISPSTAGNVVSSTAGNVASSVHTFLKHQALKVDTADQFFIVRKKRVSSNSFFKLAIS